MDKLPEKAELIQLDQIRIERNLNKVCSCENRKYTVDTKNRRVLCRSCGVAIDPYEVVLEFASNQERLNENIKALLEQKQELENYKPHLKIIKELEKTARTGPHKMHPICPVCDEPFMLTELTRFYGAKFVTGRIIERIDRQKKEREQAEKGEN